jgi:hypothetical protein
VIRSCLLFAIAGACFAQQSHIHNAKLDERTAAAGLDPVFRTAVASAGAPEWIGYTVPVTPGEHHMCCWNNGGSGCWLEGDRNNNNNTIIVNQNPVLLEGSKELVVLFRVEQHKIGKVQTLSGDCEMDAGGLPFHWLTNVNPAQSVALLSSMVQAGSTKEEERLADRAITAIALHGDAAADAALDKLLAPEQPESIRRKAVFWLGSARGRHGYDALVRVIQNDPSDKVREHAVFSLTLNKQPEAIPAIIRVAREDKSAHVRGQALFWLAQTAERKIAADEISRAIDNDPETEVKKKAVFALTRLPNGEGTAKLIEVAQSNRNAAVRKQAMFWLGQSKDARAIDFFASVLSK